MSLFDIAKSFMNNQPGAVGAISQLLTADGGAKALVEKFKAEGFGNVMQSWISQGANLPISEEHMAQILGDERVRMLAAKAGMTPEELKQKLAAVLPEIVNKLTPNGEFNAESFSMKNLIEVSQLLMKKN